MSSLISPAVLAKLLEEAEVAPTVLDVRWALGGPPGREQYEQGHIPGAVYVDMEAELASPPGRDGRHPMPSAGQFQAAMRAAGVSGDRAVVVYDAATSMAAARAWWLLRYFGHTDVGVLDGGFAAWTAAGYQLQTVDPVSRPGDFTACEGCMRMLDATAAADVAHRGILVDARAPERYRGEAEPIDPVAGHVPGAINVPATNCVDESGRFKPCSELRKTFEAAGVCEGVEVAAYCGSGVVGAHEVFALELAGYPAALYVGSWSDWIGDADRPVATGEEPA